MSRTLSLTLRAAMFAEETGEVPVCLITIAHASLAEPLRFSTDPTERLSVDPLRYGTTSRGEVYDFLPVAVRLPDDRDEAPPALSLVLDNIDRETIALLRSTVDPAEVTVEVVLASAPDDVEISFPAFDLTEADYAAQTVTLTVAIDALQTEPFPSGSFTPAQFSGLF